MSDLLALALEAHGGLERWRATRSIDATLSVSGGLWQIKGHPEGLPDIRLHLETDRPFVTIAPFGGTVRKGYFEPHRVWIEGPAGEVVAERPDPRSSFAGHTLGTPWDELHELYFTSYAMWNYLTTPFLFTRPGFEAQEIEPHTENGDVWRRLRVKFPADVPTHNNFAPGGEQIFFFSEKGLLQRLDYIAVGPASHYCFDHAAFDGLTFPTLRRVVPRPPSGPMVNGPTAVLLRIAHIAVA